MNNYSYKPKISDFPSIAQTNKATYYKTFYSGNSKKEKSPNYASNAPKLFQGLYNKTYYNNYRKKFHNNYKANTCEKQINRKKKIRIFSEIQFGLSEEETDDTIFALSEITNIDNSIAKRINKNLIWKEKHYNIYDICTSKNRKDIKDIQKRVREGLDRENFDLKMEINKKKYFPTDKVETIDEATNIMNNIKLNELNEQKVSGGLFYKNKVDLHVFTQQNRDICLKNILINLIKKESDKIKTKENAIAKALEDAKNSFSKDKDIFNNFTIDKKKKFKETELKLEIAIRNHKTSMEKIKKLNSEIHGTKDEIEKNIRDIIIYKSYADFIHTIIGKNKLISQVNINKLKYQSKERDIEFILKNSFEEFYFLLNNDYKSDLPFDSEQLNNPELLTNLFYTIESNIIKEMSERDNANKEKRKIIIEYQNEIEHLKKKKLINEKELANLQEEINRNKLVCEPNNNYKNVLEEYNKYTLIIFEELSKIFEKPKNKNLNLDNIHNLTFDLLHNVEDKLIYLFNEMDIIKDDLAKEKENEKIFKDIIEEIKIDNKNEKLKEGKLIMQKILEEKNLKFLQRMNRYKVRGPIVYPPPWVIEKKSEIKKKIEKEVQNEEDILQY